MSNPIVIEKSLSEIWSKTLLRVPKSRFNNLVSLVGVALGAFPLIVGPVKSFSGTFQSAADLLVGAYAGLLGFIIAGYAIFTTAGNPKFLVEIWKHIDSRSGLPLLKLHLLVFVRLFLVVFFALFISISVSFAFRLWPTLSEKVAFAPSLRLCLQAVVLSTLGWTISATAVQLKTLIFNLYDLTLTQVKFLEIEAGSGPENRSD